MNSSFHLQRYTLPYLNINNLQHYMHIQVELQRVLAGIKITKVFFNWKECEMIKMCSVGKTPPACQFEPWRSTRPKS